MMPTTYKRRLRSWRQRWDPEADLIYAKRLLLQGQWVEPGDRITDEMRELLGMHRLRRWWEAGVVALADWVEPGQQPQPEPQPEPGDGLELMEDELEPPALTETLADGPIVEVTLDMSEDKPKAED